MALQDLGKGEREMDKRWVDSPSFNIPHSPLVLFHLYLHANSQSPIHMHIRCIALRSPPLLRQFPCADRCRQRRRPSSSSHLVSPPQLMTSFGTFDSPFNSLPAATSLSSPPPSSIHLGKRSISSFLFKFTDSISCCQFFEATGKSGDGRFMQPEQ